MLKVKSIKQISSFFLLLLSHDLYANQTYIRSSPEKDSLVITLYSPTVNVYPDENASAFPHQMNVQLLIGKRGEIEDIYYPNNTSSIVKSKVNYVLKTAKFTPYLKNNQPMRSIIPYTVIFNFMTQEDYSGKF